jgi:GTP cyclohydrolase I
MDYSVTEMLIRKLIRQIGDDPDREGLSLTPKRVMKSWETLFGGYGQNPQDFMTTFKEPCSEIVLIKDIEFYSTCEHHMLPFIGKAHIAYIPTNDTVIGASKLIRLLEIYTRRLQIQERIGEQVTEALMEHLKPSGAACILEAQHLCMSARGIQKQSSLMVTSSLKGVFMDKLPARNELMTLVSK